MKFHKKIKLNSKKRLSIEFDMHRELILEEVAVKNPSIQTIKNKVFCIGFGKTGTTSLETALSKFGYRLGNQAAAEMLVEDWYHGKSERIINFCHTADAFQDLPFGMPGLYKELDKNFPNSKFILTVRDSEEQWYNSLIKFHAKLWAKDGVTAPNEEELKNAMYRYKGWILDVKKYHWDYPKVKLYDKPSYTNTYLSHIEEVKLYFKNRPNNLLVLNVASENSYQNMANFLNKKMSDNATFPWENKTV